MSGRRIAFVDRDGTLIEEPADFQVDALDKVRFVAGMIPALLKLRDAGWEFVMVTNQDGLGTPSFPREAFEAPQKLLLQLLESQGITFADILVDESFEHENKPTRKPGIGMLLPYLRDRGIDLPACAVIGDRDTDLQLAANLGCRGFRLGPGLDTWDDIARQLADAPRRATVERTTKETRIRVAVDLDHAGEPDIATGLGFFDHMLEQLGKHGGFALSVHCAGDLHIDEHHSVEDCALAIGQALRQALGDKRGVARFGDSFGQGAVTLPMDETVAGAAVDLSGRPYFTFEGSFPRAEVGGLATELVPHFFRSLCETGGITLRLQVRGENTHHMVEACFKSVARALRRALRRDGTVLPSTKGVL